jgi:sigma-B regulation protein RsbU (phosphoserine phosphatase)
MVVGMIDGPAFDLLEEERLDLRTCGAVMMNTDGATEAMDAKGEELGQEALEAAVARAATGPVQAIVDAVVLAVDQHAAGTPQHDDITLVVLRWRGERDAQRSSAGGHPVTETRNQP